ncbi:hypothetical protein B296_00018889 [Ensete ventricosum]|uniref:E3 ubiquitin-protein ligase RMA n=1 Tax=Ensete ventricosum TaxID=4639 RepID=A0A426YZN0_ENSVE|nr:hypothetical protein B296_00018889 [Ensete ventricosum]
MEVEDIPQVHITSDFSCDHEVEKPREKEPPMKCSTSDDADPAPPMDGLFDCSICLDSAVDPVITLCGHLYCWPCIYKWMQVESISHHQCPVCKALLSEDTLIPLHGHDSHRIKRDSDVPCRPTFHLNRHRMLNHGASNTDEEYYSLYQPMQRPQVHHNYYHQDRSSPPTALSFHSRTGDVLGGLAASVLPWLVGIESPLELVRMESPLQLVETESPLELIGTKSPLELVETESSLELVRTESSLELVGTKSPLN